MDKLYEQFVKLENTIYNLKIVAPHKTIIIH